MLAQNPGGAPTVSHSVPGGRGVETMKSSGLLASMSGAGSALSVLLASWTLTVTCRVPGDAARLLAFRDEVTLSHATLYDHPLIVTGMASAVVDSAAVALG